MTDQLRHESPELGDAAFRMMRGLARRAGDGDMEGLEQLARLEHELREQTAAAVAGMRLRGYSWAYIGNVLGVTRQAAQERFARADVLAAHPVRCQCGRPTCPREQNAARAREAGPTETVPTEQQEATCHA